MTSRARIAEECFWQVSELVTVERTVRDGWIEVSSPEASATRNAVIHAELGDDADAEIDEVVARFGARGMAFRWHVGPSATPADIGERLLAHGFEHIDTLACMCIETSRDVIRPDPAIEVSELPAADDEAFVDVIMSTYAPPEGARARLLREIAESRSGDVQRHYVARLDGEVVGSSTLANMRRGGFLQGAAVLEASRGRGVYRHMIQARLERLRTDGYELAIITARESTSAPICESVGFETVGKIDVYLHDAPQSA